MQKSVSNQGTADLQRTLEMQLGRGDPGIPKSLTSAMRSLLSAMEYDDAALVKSHLEATCQWLNNG